MGDVRANERAPVRRCVTLDDQPVPTLLKHAFQTATLVEGDVYLAVGGALHARWGAASSDLVAAARSLTLL